jgi:hypothetical protein
MAGRISVLPNRIKMRRRGEGWQADLLGLLDDMAALYAAARPAGVGSHQVGAG